jgi:acyl carrier protein
MGSDSIEAQVKELIVELLFLRDVTPGDIGDEDVIEETFDILFGDEDFDATRFRTVKAVADVVREKQAAG